MRELRQDARTRIDDTEQRRDPRASDADEKPLPCAVSAVPPSASARDGTTQLAADAGWYVNRPPPPPPPYWRALSETDTRAPRRRRALELRRVNPTRQHAARAVAHAAAHRRRVAHRPRPRPQLPRHPHRHA